MTTIANHARLRYWDMSKSSLIDEILRLSKEIEEREEKIRSMAKRLSVYRDM